MHRFIRIALPGLLLIVASEPVSAQGFEFPGRVETMPHGYYWTWPHQKHFGPPDGEQALGHDLHVRRFNPATNSFTPLRVAQPGETVDGSENDHSLIWNQPVFAHRGGTVTRCWAEAPDNDSPTKKHDRVAEIFPGGNMVWIDHGDGTATLYAHLREGTVPEAVCTNRDPFHPQPIDVNADVAPGGERTVVTGQFLGCAGNSGSSTDGPHLHIHTYFKQGGVLGPPFGPPAPLPFRSVRTKSMNLTRDTPSDWSTTTDDVLPPGPILILPAPIQERYRPLAWIGLEWTDFLNRWRQAEADGYRLHDLEVHRAGGKLRFDGIFQPGSTPPLAWIGLEWEAFLKKWQQAERDGFRMHDFETWTQDGKRVYGGIFRPGNHPPAALIGLEWNTFLKRWGDLEKRGLRMQDFESYEIDGKRVYSGIFRPGNYRPAAWVGLPFNDFLKEWRALESGGYRLHDLETWRQGGKRVYAGIFQPGTHRPAAWINQDFKTFLPNWTELELLNFRMHDLEVVRSGKSVRFFGIFEGGQPVEHGC
jgi:hypothetical protein